MEVILKLRDYYNRNCKNLIFVGERKLSNYNNCKMYFLDVENKIELNNYKKVFQEYLLFYIRNRDHLKSIKKINDATTDELLSINLLYEGKKIRSNKGLYPQIDIEKSGIYGELFNDFYLNIVKQEEVVSTYSLRSSFNLPNIKGVDLVACKIENNNLVIIFSESKFVSSISSASSSLCDDIVGTDSQLGHITKDYINQYTSFIMNKNHSIYFDKNNSKLIMNKLNELNNLILNQEIEPIDAINNLNIKIRFDFFAIYNDSNYNIEERREFFLKIVNQFSSNILNTGINKYDIEIVFIPTKNKSMDIKKEVEQWD